jgi:hypothetical protein
VVGNFKPKNPSKPVRPVTAPPGGVRRFNDPVQPTTGPGASLNPNGMGGAAVTTPSTVAAMPAPPDWLAMAKADPRFLLANPAFASQENQAMVDFGYVRNPDGSLRESTAAENPYSPLVGMRQQMTVDNANLGANAAAHGTLFSGGTISGAQGLAQGLERNIFANQQRYNERQAGITRDRDTLLSDIMSGLLGDVDELAQPAPAPPAAAAPAKPVAKPKPAGSVKPKPKPKAKKPKGPTETASQKGKK